MRGDRYRVVGGALAGLVASVSLFRAVGAQPFPPPPLVVAAQEAPLPWTSAPDIPTAVMESGNGILSGRVEIRPPTPVVGEVVRVRLTATDVRGQLARGHLEVGELRKSSGHVVCAVRSPERGQPTLAPATSTQVIELVFHAPGRQAVFGLFDASKCWTSNEVVVEGQVEVLPAVVPANTRHVPRAQVREVDARHQGGGPGRRFEVMVIDPDGFLEDATFDWGDGRPRERIPAYPVVSCEQFPTRPFPFSGQELTYGTHEFIGPGRFVVRVRVTTTACGGGNPQTAEAEWVVEMP